MEDDNSSTDDQSNSSHNSFTLSTSISSSDDDDSRPAPSKRYKLHLGPDYKPSNVSRQTEIKWKKKREEYLTTNSVPLAIPSSIILNDSNSEQYAPNENELINEERLVSLDENSIINQNLKSDILKVSVGNSYNDGETSSLPKKNQTVNHEDPEILKIICAEKLKNGIGSLCDYYPSLFECEKEGNTSSAQDESDEQIFDASQPDEDISTDSESEAESQEDENCRREPLSNKNQRIVNTVMFAESNLTVNDVILMITAFSLNVSLHDEGKLKLAKLIQVLAGKKFSNINLSKHMMNQCFSSQEENMTYCFYCTNCTKKILYSVKANEKGRYKEGYCDDCKKKQKITNASSNYFLSMDLKYQIEQIFSNPTLRDDIFKNLRSRNTDKDVYEDVYSGSLHKSIISQSTNESEYILTVNASTDGAPLTKSGKTGFWPMQLVLNDLSPKLRFKNVLLCGIFLTATEPKGDLLNLYLDEVYVKQIQKLFEEGIKVFHNGQTITLKFCTHAFIVDAVARAIVQNRIQFNGYYGCSWCYQLGEYFSSVRGIRYPIYQEGDERTHESHMNDIENAKSGNICNGVKGSCALEGLPFFDMVWSFPYEYLHALLFGPTSTILNEWKNGDSKFKLTKAEVDFIEKRFLNITPTDEVHRLPRSGILKGAAKPKGSELKSWLLYYSLPCLCNVLDADILTHYSLLVESSYTLLTTTASDEDLKKCERGLLKFVVQYAKYYEHDSITYNIHILLHAIASVRKTGPLCCNSAFPFESNIYTLKTFVNGPKGMDRQMARKYLQILLFRTENLKEFTSSAEAINYCASLFNPVRFSKSFHHGRDIVYCGKKERKVMPGLGLCSVYKKCIHRSTVYQSEKYVQSKKTDNSIVHLNSGEYGKIMDILEYNSKPYFLLRFFNVYPNNPFENVNHIKKIECEDDVTYVRPISDVKCKVMLVNARNARYLCHLPNTIEIQ